MDTRAKGVVPDELLTLAAERMGEAKASTSMADRIEAFFKQPRVQMSTAKQGAA